MVKFPLRTSQHVDYESRGEERREKVLENRTLSVNGARSFAFD